MGKASRRKREQPQGPTKRTNGATVPPAAEEVFFDPEQDTPAALGPQAADEYSRLMTEGMAAAGIAPEVIYAFKKTGFVLTPENEHLLSEAERRAWDDAIAEYFEKGSEPQ